MKGTRSCVKTILSDHCKPDDMTSPVTNPEDITKSPLFRDLKEEVGKLHRARFEDSTSSTPIPMYSGDVQTLGAFLDRFDIISSAFSWSQLGKAQRFPLYLKGYALDVFKGIAEKRRENFDHIIEDFKKGILIEEVERVFSCQLRARSQNAGETAACFASDLKQLAKRAYPNLTEGQREPFVKDCFLFGVQPDLQRELLTKDLHTLDEFVKAATTLEMRLCYVLPQREATVTFAANLPHTGAQLHDEISNLTHAIKSMKND